jgi:cytochrome c oxidase cbb3-type subunit IV
VFNDILLGIAGIEIYPVLSLVLFFTVFSVVVLRVVRMDRARVQRLARLPLEPAAERGSVARGLGR